MDLFLSKVHRARRNSEAAMGEIKELTFPSYGAGCFGILYDGKQVGQIERLWRAKQGGRRDAQERFWWVELYPEPDPLHLGPPSEMVGFESTKPLPDVREQVRQYYRENGCWWRTRDGESHVGGSTSRSS